MFGLYRFILASLVALSHFGWSFHGFNPGQWAVVCFYVLSGLLMERQFNKLASRGGTRIFYLDRFLRIYPLYVVVLTMAALMFPLHWTDLLVNYALVPLNYTGFIHVPMLLAPAWSLACEAHFYLVVPLLVMMPTVVIRGLLAASLGLFAASPFLPDAYFWAYVGFPGICFTFASGILINRRDWFMLRIVYSVMAVLCLLFIIPKFIPMGLLTGLNINVCLGYLVALPVTAFLVRLSPKVSWDQIFGLFSYPLFLVHTLVPPLCALYFPSAGAWVLLPCSLLAAGALIILVEIPFDYIRYKMRDAKRASG